jgi:hypothetical protein
MESLTGLPNKLLTAFFTAGILVLPPTITIDSITFASSFASAKAFRQLCKVLSING